LLGDPLAAAALAREQQSARQSLLTGVEELIDQIFFDPDVSSHSI
jgi:hypothetical protein